MGVCIQRSKYRIHYFSPTLPPPLLHRHHQHHCHCKQNHCLFCLIICCQFFSICCKSGYFFGEFRQILELVYCTLCQALKKMGVWNGFKCLPQSPFFLSYFNAFQNFDSFPPSDKKNTKKIQHISSVEQKTTNKVQKQQKSMIHFFNFYTRSVSHHHHQDHRWHHHHHHPQ